MSKKVFVVSSTPRRGGNSELLAEAFAQGARDAGSEAEILRIREMDLKFCIGCMTCSAKGKCVLEDGMNGIYHSVQNSDVLVFATPIYYYEMSGQLKTFLDRLNPLFSKRNRFKEVYLLASAAEDEETAADRAANGLQGWIDCFPGVNLAGTVLASNVTNAGEVKNSPALSEAYDLGKSV